ASVEEQKVKVIGAEQELNGLQKAFNELLNRIRQLEGDKKLAAQRLEHLKEREKNITQFLTGADAQLKSLEEAIAFAGKSIERETEALEDLREHLETLRTTVDEKREAFDEKKKLLDAMRAGIQTVQHKRFDAEKKVAVADTSVMNIQRSMQH